MRPAATASLPAAPRPAMAMGGARRARLPGGDPGRAPSRRPSCIGPRGRPLPFQTLCLWANGRRHQGSSNGGRVLAKWIELLEHRNGDAGYHSVRQPG
jgi:hypothetical protein